MRTPTAWRALQRLAEARRLMAGFEELYRQAMAEAASEAKKRRWRMRGRLAPAKQQETEDGDE